VITRASTCSLQQLRKTLAGKERVFPIAAEGSRIGLPSVSYESRDAHTRPRPAGFRNNAFLAGERFPQLLAANKLTLE